MALDRQTIEKVRAEISRLDDACLNALVELDMSLEWDGYRKRETPIGPSPEDRQITGSKATGALRRASMDVTRALADLRRA